MFHRVGGIVAILATVACSGCYLLSPHVTAPSEVALRPRAQLPEAVPPTRRSVAVNDCVSGVPKRSDRVDCAVDYATTVRSEYLRAEKQYSKVPGVLETILIPVGGAAVALGIEGYSGAPITGLGVGAASLLGLGTLYQNKTREKIYGAGADAITCLLSNMVPYTGFGTDYSKAPPSLSLDADLKRLSDELYDGSSGGLAALTSDLEQKLALYDSQQLYKDCSNPTAVGDFQRRRAAAIVKAGRAADKAAQAALKAGQGFLDSADKAPPTIIYSVDKINGAVDKAIIDSEADVQALAANLKGVIPDTANSLAGIKASTAAPSTPVSAASIAANREESPEAEAPRNEETDLLNAIIADDSSVAMVTQIIESVTKPPDNSKCVALTNLAKETAITLNPYGDIPVTPGDKATVTVKGATAPRVWPLFPQAPGLKSVVTANLQDSSTLEISAGSGTAEGFYPFIVMDGTTGKPFSVYVKPGEEEPKACKCGQIGEGKEKTWACVEPDKNPLLVQPGRKDPSAYAE